MSNLEDGRNEAGTNDEMPMKELGNDNRRQPTILHLATKEEEPSSASLPFSPSFARNIFGLRKGQQGDYSGMNLDDYEYKYPPDAYCKEMDADARVWRVYLDEAGPFTTVMIENFRDNIDLMLVFAGLFSAVVATTATQSAQSLQPDFSQVSALLLQELISISRASAEGSPVGSIPSSFAASAFTPSLSDLWINRFWFTSLAFSLAAALAAVLAKQWLLSYSTFVSGTPRDRVRILQFRHVNFERWGVPVIIGLLPVLIHISLMVYFVGLAIFLAGLDWPTAIITIFIGVLACAFYFVTSFLPVIFPHCPYKTPFSTYTYYIFRLLKMFFWKLKRRLKWKNQKLPLLNPHSTVLRSHTLQDAELGMVTQQREALDLKAVIWLLRISTNPSVTNIVYQSFAGLPPDIPIISLATLHRLDSLYPFLRGIVSQLLLKRASKLSSATSDSDAADLEDIDDRLERFTRSMTRLYPDKTLDLSTSSMQVHRLQPLPLRLQANMLSFSYARSRAPHFLAKHFGSLKLSQVVWSQILTESMKWVQSSHVQIGLADAQAASWELVRKLITISATIPVITTSPYEPTTLTTLIESKSNIISDVIWQYLHLLYCSAGQACHYCIIRTYTVRSCHLASCLLMHGEGKMYSSEADVAAIAQQLENIISIWQHDGYLRFQAPLGSIASRKVAGDRNDIFMSLRDTCSTLGSLASSGKLFNLAWFRPATACLLRIFRLVIGHGWRNSYHRFDGALMKNLLHGYTTAIKPLERAEGMQDQVLADADQGILHILGDAFMRKTPSAFAYFRKEDGLSFFRQVMDVGYGREILTADLDLDWVKNRLIPISSMLHLYVVGALQVAALSRSQNSSVDADANDNDEDDPLLYLLESPNLQFYVYLTFLRVIHTPRYLPSWDAIDTVLELAKVRVGRRPQLASSHHGQWKHIVDVLQAEKTRMIERMSGGRHWPTSGGPSLSYCIKKLKEITTTNGGLT